MCTGEGEELDILAVQETILEISATLLGLDRAGVWVGADPIPPEHLHRFFVGAGLVSFEGAILSDITMLVVG